MFAPLFFYLFIFVLADDDSYSIQSRILYGEDVRIEDHPYYAGLIGCGAAIISDVWILTAAHCVSDINLGVQNYLFVGGETFGNSIAFPYKKIIIHENYKLHLGLPLNDVALIQLSIPLKFSKKIDKIKLPSDNSTSFNKNILFVGRGKDETGKLSNKLQKVDLVRLLPAQCIDLVPSEALDFFGRQTVKYLEKTNICAKRETNMPTICQGDSGSPLVSGDTVIGLASYIGGQECDKLRLGFYVNVQYYVPWIKKHTGL